MATGREGNTCFTLPHIDGADGAKLAHRDFGRTSSFIARMPSDRASFAIVGLASIDAGHGWLIFALPPAEALHPQKNDRHELYFMCADLKPR